MKNKWIKKDNGQVLSGNGYYISYVKFVKGTVAADLFKGFFMPDCTDERTETALVIVDENGNSDTGRFYILNGDFRKEYEQACPNLKKSLSIYRKHKAEFGSAWSSDASISSQARLINERITEYMKKDM